MHTNFQTTIRRFFLLSIATLLFGACTRGGQPSDAPKESGPVLIGPENSVMVRKEAISAGPRLSGSLEPREQARVRAETAGSVTKVEVDLGKNVKKGEILARIEDIALRNTFVSAKSALSSAEIELQNSARQAERTAKLVEGGALSARDLEIAESNRTAAEARLAQAQAQLSQARKQFEAATVKSPMEGVISEKSVNQGDVVTIGSPLFTVIDPSSMRLEASVPSDALPVLKIGTPVTFQVRGYPNQTFAGTIEQIAPAADPVTRQIKTLISIPNPGGKLVAGLFAEGRIGAETRETIVAPIAAVSNVDQSPHVVRIKDGLAEKVTVILGLSDPQTERVEIQGPINEGDVLLTGAAKSITPGTPVKLTGSNPEASK